MSGISNSLRHELGLQGITIKRLEVSLTPASEYEFMTTCTRFLREFEMDAKLRQLEKKTTLNQYIARMFPKFLGGKKEEISQKVSSFTGLLDLWSQSPVIELYKWLFDINPKIEMVIIHNKILEKFKHLDPEFMDTPRKSLKNVSFPFKDIIDVVGKFIHHKSLRVFVENIESSQKMKRGGIQDRKVPSILLLKSALEADYECGRIKEDHKENYEPAERFRYDESKHNYFLKPKEINELDRLSDIKFVGEKVGKYIEDHNPKEVPEVEDVLANRFEGKKKTQVEEVEGLTRIAHRYLFGQPHMVADFKKAGVVDQDEADEGLTHNEMLQRDIVELEKKHKAALSRHEDIETWYRLVLTKFNDYKQNYYVIGREIEAEAKLTDFLMLQYQKSPEIMKVLKGVKNADVIELKKLKLLLGKCFEKTSHDAQYDFQRVFKFAIDYADYENDIVKENESRDQIFELLQKSPPVPDQKGLRNARTKIRELKEWDNDSPVKDKGLKHLMETDDVKDIMAVLQSEYYAESKIAHQQGKQSEGMGDNYHPALTRETVHFHEDENLLDFKIPSSILDGMTKLILRKYMRKNKSRSSSRSSKKSKKSNKKKRGKSNSKSRTSSTNRSLSKKSKRSKSSKSKGSSLSKKPAKRKLRSKSASKSKSKSRSKSSSKSPSRSSSKSGSKSKKPKKSKSKNTKKKGVIKKRTKKSTKAKTSQEPIQESSPPPAPISIPNSYSAVENNFTATEPLPFTMNEQQPRKKKLESWRDEDPIFLSPKSSRSKSVDRQIERLIDEKHKPVPLYKPKIENRTEEIYLDAISRTLPAEQPKTEQLSSKPPSKKTVKKKIVKKGRSKSKKSKSKSKSRSRSKSTLKSNSRSKSKGRVSKSKKPNKTVKKTTGTSSKPKKPKSPGKSQIRKPGTKEKATLQTSKNPAFSVVKPKKPSSGPDSNNPPKRNYGKYNPN